jgi:hypothetical protein
MPHLLGYSVAHWSEKKSISSDERMWPPTAPDPKARLWVCPREQEGAGEMLTTGALVTEFRTLAGQVSMVGEGLTWSVSWIRDRLPSKGIACHGGKVSVPNPFYCFIGRAHAHGLLVRIGKIRVSRLGIWAFVVPLDEPATDDQDVSLPERRSLFTRSLLELAMADGMVFCR